MPQPESLLRDGIAAVKAGKKEEGRRLLTAIVQQNPDSEEAWLWLAAAASSPRETLSCLNRVLAINPQNAKAAAGVRWATAQLGDERPVAKPVQTQTVSQMPSEATVQTQTASQMPNKVTVQPTAVNVAPVPVVETKSPAETIARDVVISEPDAAASPKNQRSFIPNLIVGILALLLILGLVLVGFLVFHWLP
jgi:hypothetical protein